MSRVARSMAVLLTLLLTLTPVVRASTAETWTDGIYDYESDDAIQFSAYDHVAAVHPEPILGVGGVLAVVGRLVLFDRTPDLEVVPSASDPRGPPLS